MKVRNWKYRDRTASCRDEQSSASLAAAVSRAKQTVLRKCLAISAHRMLTFTMPGADSFNSQELDAAWTMFSRWLQRMRRDGFAFRYVAVPETQKRGAWHFHVAIDEFLPIRVVQRHWSACGGGNVDVKHFNNRPCSNKVEGCAKYIGKYIGKELEGAEFGRKRYRASTGIVIDIERVDVDSAFVGSMEALKKTF